MSNIKCQISNVKYQTSNIKCQISNIKFQYQISNVKYQMSNIKCQISNVNQVKLLSERTSGVPPVIFYLLKICVVSNKLYRYKKAQDKDEG